jgi:hypothetical protein
MEETEWNNVVTGANVVDEVFASATLPIAPAR